MTLNFSSVTRQGAIVVISASELDGGGETEWLARWSASCQLGFLATLCLIYLQCLFPICLYWP